jgi:hypothetical protein
VGCLRDQELKGARNTRFRQVRAAESVITYVFCGGLYCLRCCVLVDALEGVPACPYIVWGIGLYENPSPILT